MLFPGGRRLEAGPAVKPPPFDYYDPSSVEEALALMGRLDDAKLLAGGQSLMPMLNMRYVAPRSIVDLNRIAALQFCRREADAIVIGAMTRQRDLAASEVIRNELPLLAEALAHVGHLQTRTRGTLGGSLCHLDPAAELPVAALALDAELHVRSTQAHRQIAMRDFPTFYMTPDLGPAEILTEIRFPVRTAGTGYAFAEFARREGDFAVVGVAVSVGIRAGRMVHARVAVGGAGSVPRRAEHAEASLLGERAEAAVLDAAVRGLDELECIGDVHASADYRRHLLGVLTRRAITRAVGRAVDAS